MAPIHENTKMLQRRWSNADGEKVGLWISFGIIITIIFFTALLGTLNIYLGKPISKLHQFEDEQAVRDTRADTLAQEIENLRNQLAQKTEESETATRDRESAERVATTVNQNFETQQQLVQQQNDRITGLIRERDEKIEELTESRRFGTEKATENHNLRNNLRDVEAERTQLGRDRERLRLQLSFAQSEMATHRRHCNMEGDE